MIKLPTDNDAVLNSKALASLVESGEWSKSQAIFAIFEHHVERAKHAIWGGYPKSKGPFIVEAGDSSVEIDLRMENTGSVYTVKIHVRVEVNINGNCGSKQSFHCDHFTESGPYVTVECVKDESIRLARSLLNELAK